MKKIFPDLWRPSRYSKDKNTVTSFLLTDDGIVIAQKDLAVRIQDKPVMITAKLSPAEALALAYRLEQEAKRLIMAWEEKREERKEEMDVQIVELREE